ncbi:uncharacterized protein EDB93DRAFT_1099330 [Suillus bovinus]|uniref:uncharacterized protein n=1 Tax=Suillus bovinus TaxID=48563 RepID=UPI001B85BF7B|nr:uncharacterized protein EDB93DRAFT_1099330 [Suillus bovinus]KAG2159902.1 hypothetical protein EDB93DRAFT_1099330 [Suillus bovinus]
MVSFLVTIMLGGGLEEAFAQQLARNVNVTTSRNSESLIMGRGPPRGCWMVLWLVNCQDYNYVVVILGIRTSVNNLIKTYESSDGDLEGGTVFGSTREVWAGLAVLLSLPLLISLLLHPNRHMLAIRAHVPKTVHPWVAPLENPASEVASMRVLTIVLLLNLSVIMTAAVVIVGDGDAKGM